MPITQKNFATQAPGYGINSFVTYNPVTDERVRYIEALAGLSDFGIRYPFNNGSSTDSTVSSNSNLAAQVNYYNDLSVTGTAVLSGITSPTFIFAHKVTIASGARISVDGLGGAGGAGGIDGGAAPVTGGSGDMGASTTTDPPQYEYGVSSGGGGGANSNQSTAGARGGRAAGLLLAPAPVNGVGGDGQDGTSEETLKLLGKLVPYSRTHIGGGGGGGGRSQATGFNGGDGGDGGGILYIVCEEWDNEGTVSAKGTAGSAGGSTTAGAGGGGGGGLIVVLCVRSTSEGTFDVAGGAGGASGGAAGDGGDGGAGFYLFLKVE